MRDSDLQAIAAAGWKGSTWEYPGYLAVTHPTGAVLSFGFVNGTLGANDDADRSWESGKRAEDITLEQAHVLIWKAFLRYHTWRTS